MSIVIKYMEHFILNIGIVLKCIILAILHLIHAIIPVKQTSHEWWGFWKEKN